MKKAAFKVVRFRKYTEPSVKDQSVNAVTQGYRILYHQDLAVAKLELGSKAVIADVFLFFTRMRKSLDMICQCEGVAWCGDSSNWAWSSLRAFYVLKEASFWRLLGPLVSSGLV